VYEEKWEGSRFGLSEAVHMFGVDCALPIQTLQNTLYQFCVDHKELDIWYDLMDPRDEETHKLMLSFIASLSQDQKLHRFEALRPVLHELRSVKSAAEVQLMRRTCAIGAQAIKKTIGKTKQLDRLEMQYLATVDYECRMMGANYLAYPPVVAAGDNANTIHYINASAAVKEEDLMLMDAGCEYHGYSSDITRTWPVSGKMTNAQQSLYEVVLECQAELIRSIIPGQTSINELYRKMQQIFSKSLRSLGLITEQDEAVALRLVHTFCPHNVGHHLGMDVHDCATLDKAAPLVAGNIITVEPGLYIPTANRTVRPEFRGLGIRIEDDVLITESGCEELSNACPKSVADIEHLVNQSL